LFCRCIIYEHFDSSILCVKMNKSVGRIFRCFVCERVCTTKDDRDVHLCTSHELVMDSRAKLRKASFKELEAGQRLRIINLKRRMARRLQRRKEAEAMEEVIDVEVCCTSFLEICIKGREGRCALG